MVRSYFQLLVGLRESLRRLQKLLRRNLRRPFRREVGRDIHAPVLRREALERTAQVELSRTEGWCSRARVLRFNGRRVRGWAAQGIGATAPPPLRYDRDHRAFRLAVAHQATGESVRHVAEALASQPALERVAWHDDRELGGSA